MSKVTPSPDDRVRIAVRHAGCAADSRWWSWSRTRRSNRRSRPGRSRRPRAHATRTAGTADVADPSSGRPAAVNPKKSASNSSIPSISAARRTYAGLASAFSLTPAAGRSSSDSVTIDSSPRRRLSQNADTESAPGNLPAMPTTAIALGGNESDSTVAGHARSPTFRRIAARCRAAARCWARSRTPFALSVPSVR